MHELLPIFFTTDFQPDIYVVSMQEIVPLNAMNVMKKDHKRIEQWRALLVEALDLVNTEIISKQEKQKQEELFEQQLVYTDQTMVGCYIAVFFKKRLMNLIKPKSLQLCKVKSGTMGTTGNKGAVCVRF